MFPEFPLFQIIMNNDDPTTRDPLKEQELEHYYENAEYTFLVEEHTLKPILFDKVSMKYLHFDTHSIYYNQPHMVHPSRLEGLIKYTRDFDLYTLPNNGNAVVNEVINQVGDRTQTIEMRGLLNVLRFFIDNIQHCLDNNNTHSIVFLNNLFSVYTDDMWSDKNGPTFFKRRNFQNLLRLICFTKGSTMELSDYDGVNCYDEYGRYRTVFYHYPYFRQELRKKEYIILSEHIKPLIYENIGTQTSLGRSSLNKMKKKELFSLNDLESLIRGCINYFDDINKDFLSPPDDYTSTSILIDETFWHPREHTNNFNNHLKSFVELLLLFLKESFSLLNSFMELRNLQVRLPAEQRLAFAKNYSERLQESENLPFDLLESVRSQPISSFNVLPKVFLENLRNKELIKRKELDSQIREVFGKEKTILEKYLDMLEHLDKQKDKQTRTNIKKKIYKRLEREGRLDEYNHLVSADIDSELGVIYEGEDEELSGQDFEDSKEEYYGSFNIKQKKRTKKKKR